MRFRRLFPILLVGLVLIVLGSFATPAFAGETHSDGAGIGTEGTCPGKFYDRFTFNAKCWVKQSGKWFLNNGKFQTRGVKSKYATISRKGQYSTLTYKVRMKRKGCVTCYNNIWVRGDPSPLHPVNFWNSGYMFLYSNAGKFTVWEFNSGAGHILKGETVSVAIIKGGWNVLKVTAKGSSLKFYINGTLLWSGVDSTLSGGKVGIGMYRNADAGDKLLVDWARLVKKVP
ncbi:MAG: hypothetical protein N2D54_12895 [Chloroflexota bacterium]